MSGKTLFQKILDGEIPGTLVHEDALCGAFEDIAPRAPTHVLIVPRKPITGVDTVEAEDEPVLGHLIRVAREIAEARGLKKGYRLVINVGEHGGQTVPHLHVHLLGGRPLAWPPG